MTSYPYFPANPSAAAPRETLRGASRPARRIALGARRIALGARRRAERRHGIL